MYLFHANSRSEENVIFVKVCYSLWFYHR